MYRFKLSNTSFAISPFAGINLRGHIIGNMKSVVTINEETNTEKVNYFSKEDMDDFRFNLFGLGWQKGAKVEYDRYLLGFA